jgi:nucleoside-diphosphate-sugar epimerase
MQVLILGCGYVGQAFGQSLRGQGACVYGTSRTDQSDQALKALGIIPLIFNGDASDELKEIARTADIILASIPPDQNGDPSFQALAGHLGFNDKAWTGYLSTTGIYGDRDGGWAFETDPPTPASLPSHRRWQAEQAWLSLLCPAHVFRLPGIYGPSRSALDQVKAGTARRIDKAGQVFSRAHRDDIVTALLASITKPNPGRIYNICDDKPCASSDVIVEASRLLEVPAPPLVAFNDANLNEMGKRFYGECKRISNARIKAELGWRPQFSTYVEGLADCFAKG